MIRIASGSGYWGDWPQAPFLQIDAGHVDHLVLDYLAEVTLSILSRQRAKDPTRGYATDFVADIGGLLPQFMEKGIRVIANAGGVNPRACVQALRDIANQNDVKGLKVGIVEGDDLLPRLRDEENPLDLTPLDPEAVELASIRDRLTAANAYLGAGPIVEALESGAQMVITGRCSDSSLFLAPFIHHLKVSPDDWDALATGAVVGHILECGAQASGGNFLGDWKNVPGMTKLGFPIAEIEDARTAVITKHESLGGRVDLPVIKEQLVYEIGDPCRYVTPDVVADFTTIQLKEVGKDRVEVSGIRGGPAPDALKVACVYPNGWKVTGEITYSWPEAKEKASAAGDLIRARAEGATEAHFEKWRVELIGAGACHSSLAEEPEDPPEVVLRIGAISQRLEACETLAREITALVLTGPPGATGFAAGRPRPAPVVSFWAGLLSRNDIQTHVEVLEL